MPLVDLYGHEEIRALLSESAASGKLPGSLLLHGPRGVGKQRLALWLGQLLLCSADEKPCGKCRACEYSRSVTHPDLHWYFPRLRLKDADPALADVVDDYQDAVAERLANGGLYAAPPGNEGIFVATVRAIVQQASLTPAMALKKVFVIGDAERMVPQEGAEYAANAFLKLLEEPSPKTTLILTSSEPGALLPTIRSRAVSIRVPPLSDAAMRSFLADPTVSEALDKAGAPRSASERLSLAGGAPGELFGDEARGRAIRAARKLLDAALAPKESARHAAVLAVGASGARGAFSDTLDAMLMLVGERMRAALHDSDEARALAASRDLDEAMPKVLTLIKNFFRADAAVWLRDEGGLSRHPASTFAPSSKDESVAVWAFQKKQSAGRSTDTLPDAESLHVPLVTGDRAEGVLTVRLDASPTLEQRELLDAFAAQLALFLNKERALEESRAAQISKQSQKLQKALFDSVSHELKTPLAAMSVALQSRNPSDQPDRTELQQAVQRLTRTVDHLLDATRLESGLLQPVREWCEPAELVRETVASSGLHDTAVRINIDHDLPAISVDARLIQQALNALLSNAAAHGGSSKPIEVNAARDGAMLIISVADHGPGLASGEENKVFEKFYRGPRTRPGGLGLGLSIARQLVEAHGGQLVAQNREGGGARFSIWLPIGEPMQLPSEATA